MSEKSVPPQEQRSGRFWVPRSGESDGYFPSVRYALELSLFKTYVHNLLSGEKLYNVGLGCLRRSQGRQAPMDGMRTV